MNVGDIGWYMRDNKVGSAEILAIQIVQNKHDKKFACTAEQIKVYMPFGEAGTFYATIHGIFSGHHIFPSKEELIDSL